jgi:ornithine decarboxylase
LWSRELPGIKPYYAVKCNPEPKLLGWIKDSGFGFDCASAREMDIARGSGATGEDILFANPCKTVKDISVARTIGVPYVTADSESEIGKMYMNLYRPKVLIRIAVDDTDAACPFSAKFGIEPLKVTQIANEAYQSAIPVAGISFHVGSGSKDPEAFAKAIHTAIGSWKQIVGHGIFKDPMLLDIGGGWSHESDMFVKQAAAARLALEGLNGCVVAEPGRFFAAPVKDLYVRVMGKKPARNGNGFRYTLDESIYGQFSCIPFDHAKPRIARLRNPYNDPPRRKRPATFFGRTCDSLDWIGTSDQTEELFVGDWLYIPSMGAYTTATSTEFNGFPRPALLDSDAEPDEEGLIWLENMKFPLADMLKI